MSGIFHQESGKGPPVLLLHGFCETSRIWNDFTPLLTDKFRVICPDLPGFGKSKMLKAPFTLNDVASEVIEWIQGLGLRRPVVIGHSLGGYVALALANRDEGMPAGLGLFHSTALPDNDEKKANRDKVIDFVGRNGVKPYIDTFVPGLFFDKNSMVLGRVNELLSQTREEVLTSYVQAMRDRPDQSALIARFGSPILFLCGANDELIPQESIEKQSKTAKKGTFCALPDTGHMGMLESPVESAREIAKFVTSCL